MLSDAVARAEVVGKLNRPRSVSPLTQDTTSDSPLAMADNDSEVHPLEMLHLLLTDEAGEFSVGCI